MVSDALRRAWAHLITADDIDDHMLQVGQATANAELLVSMLQAQNPSVGSSMLFVGGGTGQFLDFVDVDYFANFAITLSDLNPAFLRRARQRFDSAKISSARFIIDDIEKTSLGGAFDTVVVVLVLEHINWRLGLRNIQRLAPDTLHIIIQCNPENMASAIAPSRKLNASMRAFAATAHPQLVAGDELSEYLKSLGYVLKARDERAVADGKTMLGLSFHRA
jgi:2-polyprenyl-3-methyl-5-hydroxy-6-metoxy-1,4-benzoquinol methylase